MSVLAYSMPVESDLFRNLSNTAICEANRRYLYFKEKFARRCEPAGIFI